MSAIKLQATVQDVDIPYIERFLKGIATDINFEEEFEEFSEEELKFIALSKKEAQEGKVKSSKEVHQRAREIIEKWK
jgi:archaellum biogenesis protein FlaJ (TadC family)